ncbi:MAG: putative metal-dependent hydrolase [Gemmatimonadetes bacterium]|nr:putative metal-dependent hydrolase [Gemmatimonadota bacterium]
MTTPTPASLDDLQRYPIGRFQKRPSYIPAERAAFIDRLAAHPGHLERALDGVPEAWMDEPYRPGGWSVRQLVHHLADSHANAYLRVKLALTEDEPTIKPYNHEAWVLTGDMAVPVRSSLTLLGAIHERLVALLHPIGEAEAARALIHPENGRMTVDQVLAHYAWHGDHHVAQIRTWRAMR